MLQNLLKIVKRLTFACFLQGSSQYLWVSKNIGNFAQRQYLLSFWTTYLKPVFQVLISGTLSNTYIREKLHAAFPTTTT